MKKGLLVLICISMLLVFNVSASPSYEDELSSNLASVRDVYLSILQERRPLINGTQWKDHPIVSFADITGDDIPEMIYQDIYNPWGNGRSELTCLKVMTCKEHTAVNLFEQQWEVFAGGMGGYFLFQVENEETLYVCQLMGAGEIMERHYYRLEEQDGLLGFKEFMKTMFSSSCPEFTDAIIREEHVSLEQFETEEQNLIDSMRELLMTDPLRFPHPMEVQSTYYYPIERRALTMYDRAMSYDEAIVFLGGTVEDPTSDTPEESSEPLTMSEAYLKELQENPDFQYLISIAHSQQDQTEWRPDYYTGHPVSFYDITGDGIPEMFYAYHVEGQLPSFCRIVTYQDGELIPIQKEEGDDFFLDGSAIGNSGTLFTIRNSNHLFVKFGAIAESTFDLINEYEYIEGKLKRINSYEMETHRSIPSDDRVWTYLIGEEEVTEEEITQEFERIVSQMDKELLNKMHFFIYQPEEPIQPENISMTYDEAIAYLQEMIELS